MNESRKTAIFLALIGGGLLAVGAFWATVAYVVLHFVSKLW